MKNRIPLYLLFTALFLLLPVFANQISYDDFECNGFSCGTGWNGAWTYTGDCEITTISSPLGNYHARGQSSCDMVRWFDDATYSDVTVSFYATATSLETNEYCRYYYYDGTSYHELLSLTNGDDDGAHDFYSFNVTQYGLSTTAGVRMYGGLSGADYCYIDNVNISGTVGVYLNIYVDDVYLAGQQNVIIEADSSLTNTQHTIELSYPNGTIFCSDTILSPSVPNTVFSTTCNMPTQPTVGVMAKVYVSSQPTFEDNTLFNVSQAVQDLNKVQIQKVYYSPQVLQGGSTEIFAIINTGSGITLDNVKMTLVFPDLTTRQFALEKTTNANEYKVVISDTYKIGTTYFTIQAKSGVYYDTYTNNYEVVAYNVDFVSLVNQVSEVLNVKTVERILEPSIEVHGTEYRALDNGRMFIQLLDGYNAPINNSDCYLSIYYPNNVPFKYKQKMSYADEGLYYYDFLTPYINGVYMASSYCVVGGVNTSTYEVYSGFETGISGGSGWNADWVLNSATFSTLNPYAGTYSLLSVDDQDPYRTFNSSSEFISVDATFYYKASDLETVEYVYVYLYDASSVPFLLLSVTDGDDDGVWTYVSQSLSLLQDGFDFDGELKFSIETSGNLEGNDYFYLDEVNIELIGEIEVNATEYQVVRGSGEVHVTSDGKAVAEKSYGELYVDSFLEGFYLYYDVYSKVYEDTEEVEFSFDLYEPFPCGDHLSGVQYYNGTQWLNISYTTFFNHDFNACALTVEKDLEVGEIFQVRVNVENYWKEQLLNHYAVNSLLKEVIEIGCYNYQLANNLTAFQVPQTNSSAYPDDFFYQSCNGFLDTFYHYESELNTSFLPLLSTPYNFTKEQMDALEEEYIHIDEAGDEVNQFGQTIINALALGDSYSLAILSDPYPPVNPDWATYFSSISSSYLIYLAQGQINESAIADAVWQYNETINPNIIQQFTSSIWSYINRTLTEFPFFNYTAIAEAVWGHNSRNLTYYETTYINTTAIAFDVWDYSSRNLTYYPQQDDLTNYTKIQEDVWDYATRTLTEYPELNKTELVALIWNYTSRNLTYYPAQFDLTNYSKISEDTWTYSNRSLTEFAYPEIDVGGTLYHTGDDGILFVRLHQGNNPVESALCNTTIIYPNGTLFIDNDAMDELVIQNGMYDYDFTVPNVEGVYPYYVDCSKGGSMFYTAKTFQVRDIDSEVWGYGTRNLTDSMEINATQIADAVWNFTDRILTFYPNTTDETNYTKIYEGVWNFTNRILTECPCNATEIAQEVWNFTNRVLTDYPEQIDLTNYSKISEDVWNYTTRVLTYYPVINETAFIENIWVYSNRTLTFYPTQEDLTNYSKIYEGVWNYTTRNLTFYQEFPIDVNEIALAVWNATVRNLTQYPEQVDLTNYTKIQEFVWDYTNRTLTEYPANVSIIAQAVWEYVSRNLTYYPAQVDLTNYTAIFEGVWSFSDRNLTYFPEQVDMTNYTAVAEFVWNFTDRIITECPYNVSDKTNYTKIQEDVWNYTTRVLTSYPEIDEVSLAGYVWNYTTRNLTYYPVQTDLTNYTAIIEGVWNHTTRNLTFYEEFPVDVNQIAFEVWNYTVRNLTQYSEQVDLTNYTKIQEDVWDYINRSLTEFPDLEINVTAIAEAVWNNSIRNLTYYPVQTDLTDYAKIQAMVWNATIRNLTYYEEFPINFTELAEVVWNATDRALTDYNHTDVTDYAKIQAMVWNATIRNLTFYEEFPLNLSEVAEFVWSAPTRNLTYYPAQVDLTNYTAIIEGVWNNPTRNLTYYEEFPVDVSEIANAVWNVTVRNLTQYPVQLDLTNYTKIQEDVWAYVNRSLTEYPANISLIAEGVWNYVTRNLTYYPPQVDLTNYTAIYEGVWAYTVRNLTYYPAQEDLTNYTKLADYVWNYTDRIITECPCNVSDKTNYTRIQEDVWAYVNRTLSETEQPNASLIADAVWTYVVRNLTYYPPQVDLTDYEKIQEMVWNATERNLTYYPPQVDLTNYSAIFEGVWNFTDRILTFYPNTTDETNYSRIYEGVWNFTDRILTECPCNATDFASAVWNFSDRILTFYPNTTDETNYSQIFEGVWNYSERLLTGTEDVTNYSYIFEGVWNYTTRELTYYPELNLTALAEEVWNYTNRSLTEYLIVNGTCDFSLPEINYCFANDTFVDDGESLTLGCNVTDNFWVDWVRGTINGTEEDFAQSGDIWTYEFDCNVNTTGVYNWTFVLAKDNIGLYGNYTPNISFQCDFNNFAPYVEITDPSELDIFLLPKTITYDMYDVNGDELNTSLALYQSGVLQQVLTTNLSGGSYVWSAPLLYGDYELVLNACELNTTESYCTNDTVTIKTVQCLADWIPQYGSCDTSDQQLKTYYDANNCSVTPYPSVPVDNGTNVPCDYCQEDLFTIDTACAENGYLNRTWVDANYGSCCAITGLVTDCSIDYTPYNETQSLFCGESEIQGITECQVNPSLGIEDKEYCLVQLPQNYSEEEFNCISYIEYEDEVIQVNPEYNDKSGSLLSITALEETDTYFQSQNGLVNVYMTGKNLQPEYNYTMGVKCSSPDRVITGEAVMSMDYENLEFVFSRADWMKDNVGYIIMGTILFIMIAGALWWLWGKAT